jgi:hypothetical protein
MAIKAQDHFDESQGCGKDRVDPRRYPSRLTFLEQSELERAMQRR